MKKVIVAGATGYLGLHLVKTLKKRKLPFQAIARNKQKLKQAGLAEEEIIQAEVTQANSLEGKLTAAEVLISTVGITRQKDGLTYMEVDYQANLNLLQAAKKAGIKKFIYVSVLNGNKMRNLQITAAKERFVDALKASGMDYLIVRPNGFFSDLKDFLDMAKKGRVYLFGDGDLKLNPIHGADLATAIIESIDSKRNELLIGGPDILSQNEIAEMALKSRDKKVRITHFPNFIRTLTICALKTFTSPKTYGPFEFFLSMSAQDNVAPRFGVHRLKNYFREEADQLG